MIIQAKAFQPSRLGHIILRGEFGNYVTEIPTSLTQCFGGRVSTNEKRFMGDMFFLKAENKIFLHSYFCFKQKLSSSLSPSINALYACVCVCGCVHYIFFKFLWLDMFPPWFPFRFKPSRLCFDKYL